MKKGAQQGRPLIGVTTSEVREPKRIQQTPESEPKVREMVLGLTYLRAIEAAGAIPMVIPPLPEEAIASLIDRLDGICLSGGPDLDPATYDAEPHPHLGPTEPDLDHFEMQLIAGALERRMPVLAICRGAQMLNVALGGDLYQDLPDELHSDVDHRKRTADAPDAAHEVEVEPSSLLSAALHREGSCEVNSFHHQAAHRLGRELKPVAWAPDGVVEGIELPAQDFVVGVQWHAEAMIDRPEQLALFEAFVEAAGRYDAPPARVRRAA